MMTLRRIAAACCVLIVVTSASLPAQRPQERRGFWIGFGLGYGSAGFSCDSCTGGRVGALSGFLKMGGTLSPRLLLGGETNGWVRNTGGATETRGNASLAVYYYPTAAKGLFLKGGAGLSRYASRGGFVDWTGGGFGLLLGAGYDVRLGRNASLTPVVNLFGGNLGTVDAPGYVGSGGYTQNVVQLAVGVTFH